MAAPQDAEIHLGSGSGSGSGNGSGNSLGSGNSSSPPPSRSADGEFSSPPAAVWEDAAAPPQPHRRGPPAHPPAGQRVKFMCSYGGKIHPRAHDHRLAYLGGETKIVGVDRSVRFPQLYARLAALPPPGLFAAGDLCIKYQLPGEDLDALISVTNDEDVENMMFEYDRLLQRCSPSKPARLRLFLFTSAVRAAGFPSNVRTPDRRLFADFLDSMPTALPVGPLADPVMPPPAVAAGSPDVLLEVEQTISKIAIPGPSPVSGSIPAAGESNSSKNQGEGIGGSGGELLFLKKPENTTQAPKQEPAEVPNAAAQPEVPPQQRPPQAADEGLISAAAESHAAPNAQTTQEKAPATTRPMMIPLAYLQDSGLAERIVCPSSMATMYVIPSPPPHGLFPGASLPGLANSQGFYTAMVPAPQSVAQVASPLQPPYPVQLNQGQADGNGAANGTGAPHLLAAYDSAGRTLYYVRHGVPSPVCAGAISAYQSTAATSGDEQGRFTSAQPAAAAAPPTQHLTAAVITSATSSTAAELLNSEGKNGAKPS